MATVQPIRRELLYETSCKATRMYRQEVGDPCERKIRRTYVWNWLTMPGSMQTILWYSSSSKSANACEGRGAGAACQACESANPSKKKSHALQVHVQMLRMIITRSYVFDITQGVALAPKKLHHRCTLAGVVVKAKHRMCSEDVFKPGLPGTWRSMDSRGRRLPVRMTAKGRMQKQEQ